MLWKKKRTLTVIILIILMLAAIALPLPSTIAQKELPGSVTVKLSLKPKVKQVGEHSMIIVDVFNGKGRVKAIYPRGGPAVPVLVFTFLVPPGSKLLYYNISFSAPIEIELPKPLAKTPPPTPLLPYNTGQTPLAAYPNTTWWSADLVKWRGVSLLVIKCFPADVIGDRKVRVYTSILFTARLATTFSTSTITDPVVLGWAREESIATLSYSSPVPLQSSSEPGLLIITREMFLNSTLLQDYVSEKQNKGYNVTLVTVEDILASGIGGRDIPEKIWNYTRQEYLDSGGSLKYLLIIGDVNGTIGWPNGPYDLSELEPWEVPTRYFYNPDGTDSYSHTGNYTPSDWYYACFDTTWDTDGDEVYGEAGEDQADWAPELAVSRIPVRSIVDLDSYLNDLLAYNTTSIDSFMTAGSVLTYFNENGQGDYGNQGDTDTELVWEWSYNVSSLLSNTSLESLYEHYPVLTKITSPDNLTTGNLTYTLLNDTLHTNPPTITVWFAHGCNDSVWRKIWYDDTDGDGVPDSNEIKWEVMADTLVNDGMQGHPITLTAVMACMTAYYDDPNDDSLGETMLKNTTLLYIGWNRVTWGYAYVWDAQIDPEYWGLSEGLTFRFFDYLLNDTSPWRLDPGFSLVAAKTWLSTSENMSLESSRKVWFASSLLGDPSQPIIIEEAPAPVPEPVIIAPLMTVGGVAAVFYLLRREIRGKSS